MKRTTRSGLTITYSEFWLDAVRCQDQLCQRVSCHRKDDRSIPLSRKEAEDYYHWRGDLIYFTDEAQDWMEHLLGMPSRYY